MLASARVEPDDLDRVTEALDQLAERWHSLRIGEELTLEWLRPERRPSPRPNDRETRGAVRPRR